MREVASAIVGVGYTEISRNSGRSTLRLAAEAATAALADAGLERSDVDGIITYSLNDSDPSMALATALGIQDPTLMLDWGDGGGNLACGVVGLRRCGDPSRDGGHDHRL
jgi:3-oxoacyl-[acyl-carrier-protein] synthase III